MADVVDRWCRVSRKRCKGSRASSRDNTAAPARGEATAAAVGTPRRAGAGRARPCEGKTRSSTRLARHPPRRTLTKTARAPASGPALMARGAGVGATEGTGMPTTRTAPSSRRGARLPSRLSGLRTRRVRDGFADGDAGKQLECVSLFLSPKQQSKGKLRRGRQGLGRGRTGLHMVMYELCIETNDLCTLSRRQDKISFVYIGCRQSTRRHGYFVLFQARIAVRRPASRMQSFRLTESRSLLVFCGVAFYHPSCRRLSPHDACPRCSPANTATARRRWRKGRIRLGRRGAPTRRTPTAPERIGA